MFLTFYFYVLFMQFCILCSAQYNIISGLSQNVCIASTSSNFGSYYKHTEDDLVPSCADYVRDPTAYACDQVQCPTAGYTCNNNNCEVDLNSCMIYYANTAQFQNTYYTAMFKPECLNDGTWAPKQCKGDANGRCFCYDQTGKRIFGQATKSEATDMTCACSRKKSEMVSNGRIYSSLHCDSTGNYEPLQCDTGLCWCAEPKTGDLTSKIVPEKNMQRLPCYEASSVGSQYLRQCESEQYAIAIIREEFRIHGVTEPNLRTLVCDGDGAYGAYNISSGIAYCTWRDGTNIQSWASNVGSDLDSLDCNCARDYKLGLLTLTCNNNGNYLPLQPSTNGQYFCVDSDGFRKSDAVTDALTDCSNYY